MWDDQGQEAGARPEMGLIPAEGIVCNGSGWRLYHRAEKNFHLDLSFVPTLTSCAMEPSFIK